MSFTATPACRQPLRAGAGEDCGDVCGGRVQRHCGYGPLQPHDLSYSPAGVPPKGGGFLPVRLSADASGAPAGFTVLLGMELRHYWTANDYLIYGVTENFIKNAGNLMNVWEPGIKALCEQNGFLIYQAHPFRVGIRRTDPKNIDGVEVYNGKTDDRRNAQALAWAKENGKLMVSGPTFTPRSIWQGAELSPKTHPK